MFIHNFKYSLKTLFRNKMLVFWTFAFPIILGTFFNMAFSNIINEEKLQIIDIAIVDNEDYKSNQIFKTAIEGLSDENSKDRMFNTKLVDEEKAKEMLDKEEIVGYLEMQENQPKLVFQKNGVSQTIFKYVIEEIIQRSSIIENISKDEIQKQIMEGNYAVDTQSIINSIIEKTNDTEIEFQNTANKNLNYVMIEFYTLIAMTCLYGGILGMFTINQTLPNMSNKGKRVAVAPTKKNTVILSSLLAGYVAQLIGLVLLFVYTVFVLKVNYGENIALVILTAMIGSLTGLAMGVAVGTLSKKNEAIKSGILIAITMTGCFLAGMMGMTMKYVIDTKLPILNKINPASIITDAFYSLYYYNTLERFWFDIISLAVICVVLITISFLSLRRQKYDSI